MADVTINDLPNVSTPLSGTEIFHGIQSSADVKASATIIANFVMNDSNYSPLIVNITGNHTIVSTNIRKQYIIATISSNATVTFPGSYGDGKEIIVRNSSASAGGSAVICSPDGYMLYKGDEATYFWDGTQFVRRIFFSTAASGFRGIIQDIINGSMTLWDIGTSFVSPPNGQYLANRFQYIDNGVAGTVTITADLDTPNPNYVYSMKIACTATDTPDPTDNGGILYKVEGHDMRKYFNQYGIWGLYAKAVNKPGVYCVAMCNGSYTRCYVSEVNIGTNWTFIPIPAILFNQTPISGGGSWNVTTGVGLNIFFLLTCGTAYQGTPYQWNTSATFATSNQVNFFDSTSNELYITAITFNPGTEIQGFNGFNIEQEKAKAQRYLYRPEPKSLFSALGDGRWFSATNSVIRIDFPVEMRDEPSFSYEGVLSNFALGLNGGVTLGAVTSMTKSSASLNACVLNVGYTTGGQTIGYGTSLYTNNQIANSILFDAEL